MLIQNLLFKDLFLKTGILQKFQLKLIIMDSICFIINIFVGVVQENTSDCFPVFSVTICYVRVIHTMTLRYGITLIILTRTALNMQAKTYVKSCLEFNLQKILILF